MAIPLTYSARNIIARKRSVAVTVVGVALSVMVYVVISATAAGIERVAVSSGEPDNVVILARGAATDDASRIPKNAVPVLSYLPEVARDSGGNPLASVEAKATRPIPRVGSSATSGADVRFTTVRGVEEIAFAVHRRVRLIEGRMPQAPGEIVIGRLVPSKLGEIRMGDELLFGRQPHKVVGIFSAQGQIFDGEIWMAYQDALSEFDLDGPNVVVARLKSAEQVPAFIDKLDESKQVNVEAKGELDYYKEVQKASVAFSFLGNLIGVFMGLGAVFAGMNTMYAAMSRRLRELGTLRALGFGRYDVAGALLAESFFLGTLGGALGLLLSLAFNGVDFNLFDIAIEISVGRAEAVSGALLALAIGLLGGFMPAKSAAQLAIVDALRHA